MGPCPLNGKRKFVGILTNECLSSVLTTPSMIPTINPCRGFSVIAGVVDTGDKFIAISKKLAPSLWSGCVRCLQMHLFMAVLVKLLAAVSHFCGKISPFWFEIVLSATGASDHTVSDVPGCAFSWRFQWHHWRPHLSQRPDKSLSSHGDVGSQFCRKNTPRWHWWTIFWRCRWLVMSNQHFFKIVCFRFPTNVPKKIEYICFWNKIHYRTKTFSFRFQNFWSKSN